MTGFTIPPEHQGQIVEISFADAMEHGCIRRVHDRSDGETTYYLHRWLAVAADEPLDPWNGDPRGRHCWKRGRKITEEQADRLLGEVA